MTFKVSEDGTLEAIASSAKKASKATNEAAGAADNYSKKQKGVAGATSNSTKAFSKMTSGINGGLVPAYAEIAARVFAISAAFNVLARNNALLKLEEGLNFTGRAAGRNLPLLADSLVAITDGAISASQAMKTVAVGISAGFSDSQLKGLAQVAKGAALALGRDMTDAIDRLTRGAAKLEPEIVDELGIMVRLDDAVENYARTVDKSVGSLTQFERRMAFTNAIIDQGITKYGALSESLNPSAYDQIAASLSNIQKELVGGLSEALAPIAGFLSENIGLLGALTAAYAGLVAKSIVGGIASLAASSAEAAMRTENQTKYVLKAIKPNEKLGKAFNEVAAGSDRSANSLDRMLKSLNMTINMTTKDMAKLKTATKYRNLLNKEIYMQQVAQFKLNATNAIGTLQEVGLSAGVKAHWAALVALKVETTAAMANATGLSTINIFLSGTFAALGSTARFAGAAIMFALPLLAGIASVVALVGPYIMELFSGPEDNLSKVTEKNAERFEEFNNVIIQYNKSIIHAKTSSQAWAATMKPLAGLITETSAAIDDLIGAATLDKINIGQQIEKEVASARASVDTATNLLSNPGTYTMGSASAGVAIWLWWESRKISKAQEEETQRVEELNDRLKLNTAKAAQSYVNSLEKMKAKLGDMDPAVAVDGLALVNAQIDKTTNVIKNLIEGKISPEEAGKEIRDMSTEANAAVDSFTKFNDVLSAIKDTLGDLTSTWGTFGPLIDDVQTGVNALDALTSQGIKGRAAAREKAVSMLKLFGIDPDIDPVAQVKEKLAKLKEINKDSRALELKSASQGMIQSGTASSLRSDSREALLLDQISLQERVVEQTVKSGKVEQEEKLKLIGLLKEYNSNLFETAEMEAEMAERLGGPLAGALSNINLQMEALFAQKDAQGNLINPSNLQIIETLNSSAKGMISELSKLGPEGEVVAAVAQGALNMAEAFTIGFQRIEDGGSKLENGLMMAGAAVQALGSIQAAQGKAAVAAIDKQIEAEKKRDGKSAESVAKIAQLEKKKERAARKAFEQNKKMQIASAVINTAAAVAGQLSANPVGPWNIALAAMMGALGAAQIAIISSQSFDGGGGAAMESPSSVSVGQRRSSVDMAKSTSAAGELNYFRGAQGTGGPESFKPAFSGMKYRASGGETTGFMVGEQGPELFVPEKSGRIVPNDQIQQSAPVTANINISAVDAAGVEQVLMRQRGNIIGMIREAANANGETFLESVSTMEV